MTRRQANLLIISCAWTLYIWVSFIVIQTRQHTSIGFKVVHGVLALISVGLAFAVGRMGWQARRRPVAPSDAPEAVHSSQR